MHATPVSASRAAYILLLLTALFWGGNAVAGKLAIGHVSPMVLAAGRWCVAFVILLAIGWPRLVADWPRVKQHWLTLAVLGFLGFTVFNVILYSALVFTTAINVTIEQGGMPMLIFLANFLFFGLRARAAQIAGFLLSVAGVLLTASHGDPRRLVELDVNFGDALMLVAVIIYAGYTVALRFKPALHWQSLMIVLTFAASVTSLPFVAAEYAWGTMMLPDLSGWVIVAYAAIFPSIISQIFYIRGVELIGSNRAGLFINMVPIFGTLLSILILGEDFRLYHALAMALVLGGIWLAESKRRAT